MGSPLKGKNFSCGAYSFLIRVDPIKKGGNNENNRVIFLESVLIHLNKENGRNSMKEFLLVSVQIFMVNKVI